MEKHSKCAGKMNARTRRHKGGFVAFCLITALILVVGTGLVSQRVDGARSLSENNQVTSSAQVLPEVNSHIQKASETFEIAADPEYGEFEKGKVLVAVDETTDRARLDALLETTEFIYTKDISDQDISAGFVQIEVSDNPSMEQVLAVFNDAGLKAQPNYVYHTVADEAEIDDSASVDDTRADIVDEDAQMIPEGDALGEPQSQETSRPASDLDILAAFVDRSVNAVDEPEALSITADQISDPGASQQWALESLDLYRAWGIAKCKEDGATSPKVSVAVIDTGCAVTHEDLINNVRATYNSSTLQPGVDQVADLNGHGTHVAGIVAADANNGIGVAGTSYDAGLVIIKATTDDAGRNFTTATLAQAYTWLLTSAGAKTNAQAYNVRVVNMSVGGEGSIVRDDLLYKKITDAKNVGILTVCAAGNAQGTSEPPYNCIPGDYEDCFTVINLQGDTSADPNDSSGSLFVQRASGSNYNVASGELSQAKNISAPGTSVYSTVMSGAYGYMSGTSMASPAVAGVAALLFAYDASLSADDVRALLEQTATDIGDKGWDAETGYGEVDAYHALQVVSAEIANGVIDENGPVTLALCSADSQSLDSADWTWESSDPGVLQVDSQTGEATPVGNGSVTLTATYKDIVSRTISKQVKVGTLDLSTVNVAFNSRQTFTGSQIKPNITVTTTSNEILHEGVDYVVHYGENLNAGSVGTITITAPAGSDNSTSKTVEFEIEPYDLSQMNTVNSISPVDYTGFPVEPHPVLNLNGYSLLVSRDYDITYIGNVNPGEGLATITGKGNFTGESLIPFRVQANFADAEVELLQTEYTYTGGAIEPELRVTYFGKTLVKGFDYTVTYNNNVNAGTATVTVKGNIGYDKDGGHPQTFEFKINPVNISNSGNFEVGNIIPLTYSGAAQTPTPEIKYWGRTLQKDVDYSLSYSSNIDANDNARVIITAKSSNFTGTRTAGFQIKPRSLTNSGAKITGITDLNYRNGEILSQSNLKVALDGVELSRNMDYTVSYKNYNTNTAASPTGNPSSNVTYYVVITGKGNYSGSIDSSSNNFTVLAPGNSSTNGSNNSSDNTDNSSLNQDPVKTSKATGTWKKSGGKWWFAYDSATQKIQKKTWPANEWVIINGKSYHFDKNGYMNSKWYKHTNNKWYWLGSDGAMRTSTWAKVSGKWYYLDGNGQMKTGRFSVSNAWYYCNSSGAMYANKWVKANNAWYWATGSGAFKMGWQKVKGKWYYLDPSQQGAMKTGFYTVGTTTYYSNGSGAMLTGWQRLTKENVTSWYYFSGSGAMQKSKWIQGKYWVESDGRMATSRWVDDDRYYVDSSGKWVPNKKK